MAEDEPKETGSGGHETRDINAAALAWFAIGLIGSIIAISFIVREMLSSFEKRHPADTSGPNIHSPAVLSPEPRLQSNPAGDLQRFREKEDAILTNYHWVDRQAGIVGIPIERAMDLVAQRGLTAPPSSSGKTPLLMRQEKADAKKPPP